MFSPDLAVPFAYHQRSYQIIELANGIRGLIIVDPSEDIASCCLSVATGHHANPEHIPGLAHLCEHMITLSSKAHPTIDGYRKKVYEDGGARNALTTNEVTSFFFSVPVGAKANQLDFRNLLDMFASNFSGPKFEASYSNREILAVDNEHVVNKSKANRLLFQGYKLLANRDHPFARFSTGNFESLTEGSKSVDIRTHLLQFFKKEYLPSRMSFVLRGPQSLNYLQKLAIESFGKPQDTNRPILKSRVEDSKLVPDSQTMSTNIIEQTWSKRYVTKPFPLENLQRVVLINKNMSSTLRIAFPVCYKDTSLSEIRFRFFIDYWCESFGAESSNTIASALFLNEFITDIITKTNIVTYDTTLLEIEISLTEIGLSNISKILEIVFDYISLFDVSDAPGGAKFIKHLAKSMSQFNGIGIFNFLYSEAESQSVWETKRLSCLLLTDVKSYGQFFVRGATLYDESIPGFKGGYNENGEAKSWWMEEAKLFCTFMKQFLSLKMSLLSYLGDLKKTHLNWVVELPDVYTTEKNFDFEYKIAKLNPQPFHFENTKTYKLNLAPPNMFADHIVDSQLDLLKLARRTVENSSEATLGYATKNNSNLHTPKLFHFDDGCQLWIKTEIDNIFRNKAIFSMELISTKIGTSPKFVVILEILIQLIRYRVNEYLYPAMVMNYSYDIFPSFKGDTGLLLQVSGPKQNFVKVLTVLINEIKYIVETIKTLTLEKEFKRAKQAILLKYRNGENMDTFEKASFGLMASVEEDTWMLEERIDACENISLESTASMLPEIFRSCYLTAFLQGDVHSSFMKNDILPVVSKLVTKFEGSGHSFPSSVLLPVGSAFYVCSRTNNATNGIEYFIQTCKRCDLTKRSLTKFLAFIMSNSLTFILRSKYQLGYIVLVGLRSFRKIQGIHIGVVGGYSPSDLNSKIDAAIMEWYEHNVRGISNSEFQKQIENFITSEKSISKTSSSNSDNSSILFGVLGSSAGGKKIVLEHNSYWEQIHNKTYAFSNNTNGDDSIDFDVVQKLTIEQLDNFVKQYVLPTSKCRSKFSVRIESNCSKQEIEKNSKGIQIFLFLSSMGLPVKQDKLEEILREAGDSQVALYKNLYKYYRRKGKSIRLITTVMAKLSASVLFTTEDLPTQVDSVIPEVEIDSSRLREWQQRIGYVGESVSMKQRLVQLR